MASQPHEVPSADRIIAEAMAAAEKRAAEVRDEDILVEETDPLIPPGEYQAVGLDWKVLRFRQYGADTLKLVVRWSVLVPDRDAELGRRIVVLPRHYNIAPASKGRFRAGKNSDLCREAVRVTGRRIQRRDRLSGRVFSQVLCLVEVATVDKDSRGRPLGLASYSVVRRVIERLAGGNPQ